MAKKSILKNYTALSAEMVLKNLPFFFFLSFLAIIYIANTHYSERKVTEIQTLEKELKHLSWHYRSLKAQLMYNSKESEVEKSVKSIGLETSLRKPRKIVISEEE